MGKECVKGNARNAGISTFYPETLHLFDLQDALTDVAHELGSVLGVARAEGREGLVALRD